MAAQCAPNGDADKSVYFTTITSPIQQARLNRQDAAAYLERIQLPAAEYIERKPSLDLLSSLLMQQHLNVPYDTSAIHVSTEAWQEESKVGQSTYRSRNAEADALFG